jgi:hypothetical protein
MLRGIKLRRWLWCGKSSGCKIKNQTAQQQQQQVSEADKRVRLYKAWASAVQLCKKSVDENAQL